jgi:PAS domain S-box-containing protein
MLLEQYKEAIENSNIVSKTDINGIITFVNDEFCTISGYSREELIGRTHNIVKHPDIPIENFEKLWNTITNKETYKSTVRNRAKDGSDFYLNTTITPILNRNGNIEEFIAIRYDVTKEIELKFALDKKQEILFMQSRFASLGQMIANIAHQWRQPLSQLNLTLFSLKKASEKSEKDNVLKYYNDSKKLIKDMSQTIEDFSNFFNPNKKTITFKLTDAINDAIEILKNDIKKDNINITIKSENISVDGISNELTQVIINLIINAKDAFSIKSIENRQIDISVSKSYIGIEVFAFIIIKDNAGGILEENLERIFEPYFTTKHSSLGTGIGLFISNLIIQKSLNGTIEAINVAHGAKFTITIPITKVT